MPHQLRREAPTGTDLPRRGEQIGIQHLQPAGRKSSTNMYLISVKSADDHLLADACLIQPPPIVFE
jgi:hypothetical protein